MSLKNKMPEIGEICYFHDEPLSEILNNSDNCSFMIVQFYLYEDNKYITRSDYAFNYCTQLVRDLENE